MTHLFEPDLELEVALTGLAESPRGLSFALSLPLGLAALAILLFARIGPAPGTASRNRTQLSMALADTILEPLPADPAQGAPQGTNTVDPALRRFADLHPELPQAPRPEPNPEGALGALPQAPAGLPLLPLSLPLAPGGNGLGGGTGGGVQRPEPVRPLLPQAAAVEVDMLRIIKQTIPVIKNAPKGLSGSVLVRLTLDAEGVPLTATPLDGPQELWPKIVASVLQWRFHVPDREKPHAPIRLDVRFKLFYQ